MDDENEPVHHAHMARKEKKPSKPKHFLRKWRKHRGYTVEALAAELEMSHASLSRIERGLQPYSEPILERLAWVLRCTPSDLLSRDPNKELSEAA